MAEYTPGVCNIGKKEIMKRYAFGAAGLVIAVALAYFVVSYSMPRQYLLALFIPLVMAFEGFYQGHFGFCVGYATKGIYDLGGSGGGYGKVTDAKSHKTDMDRATKITIYSVASSLVVTIIVYLFLR